MILPYGGQHQPVKAWERNMSLREAISMSNVPIYQELARRTGLEKMRSFLAMLHYGSEEVGNVVDMFWLCGPLQISAVEQTLFLARLAQNKLPFTEATQAATREIILLEQGDTWTLYGKTGTAVHYSPPLGWWVGWVEKSGALYVFALNMDMPGADDARKRVEIGKACLKVLRIV
jgi:beta-lactamase class D